MQTFLKWKKLQSTVKVFRVPNKQINFSRWAMEYLQFQDIWNDLRSFILQVLKTIIDPNWSLTIYNSLNTLYAYIDKRF